MRQKHRGTLWTWQWVTGTVGIRGERGRFVVFYTNDNVIKWKRNWSFVRGIHRSAVNSPHNGQWRGALMFSLICAWINGWVNNGEAGDLRRHRAHYDVTIMNINNFFSIRCRINMDLTVGDKGTMEIKGERSRFGMFFQPRWLFNIRCRTKVLARV